MFFMNFLLWYGCPDYWHQNAWTEVEVWIWSTWPDSHNRGKPSVFLVSILKLAFKVVDLITKLLPFWGLESVRFEWPYPELICCFCSCKLWPNSHSSGLNDAVHQRLPSCWCSIYFSFSIFLNSWVPIYGQVQNGSVLENPFSCYKVGQTVTARIVAKPNESDGNRKGSQWELSVRSEMVTG